MRFSEGFQTLVATYFCTTIREVKEMGKTSYNALEKADILALIPDAKQVFCGL